MFSMLLQGTSEAANESSGGSAIASFLPLLLIGGVMYFLLIRPQRRRMREAQELIRKIAEGDEVITSGGIYGFVSAIDGDTIWLDVAENVEIRIHRSAITRRIDPAVEPAGGEPVAEPDDGPDDADGDSKKKK